MSAAAAHRTPALHSVSARSAAAGVDPFDDALDVAVARDHAAIAAGIGGTEGEQRQRRIAGGAALQQARAASRAGSAGCRHTAPPPRRRRNAVRPPGRHARCRGDPAARRRCAARPPAARRPSPARSPRRCGRTPARSLPADGAAWGGRRSCAGSWAAPTSCACRSRRPGSRRCVPSLSLVSLAFLWRWRLRRVKACRYPAASNRVSECNTVTRTLLLDLDGTLVHSVPDLAAALNRLMQARGLAGVLAARDGLDGRRWRGDAGRAGLRRPRHAPDAGAVAEFSADYVQHAAVDSQALSRRRRGLRALADEGWRLAVCTNKPEAAARALLSALGLARCSPRSAAVTAFRSASPIRRHLLATLKAAGGDAGARGDGGRSRQRRGSGARRRTAVHLRRLGLWAAGDGRRLLSRWPRILPRW